MTHNMLQLFSIHLQPYYNFETQTPLIGLANGITLPRVYPVSLFRLFLIFCVYNNYLL